MSNRPSTLEEVARLAGVSTGTVSRVINNAPHVSTKSREAVQRAIEELGYVPNTAARSLATARRGAVVLAISSDDPALFANQFFAEVIAGVNAVIEETDLQLMLVLAASERGRSRLTRILQSRAADGVMLLALRENDPLSKIADEGQVPVVHGGRSLDRTPRTTSTPTTAVAPGRPSSTWSRSGGSGSRRSPGRPTSTPASTGTSGSGRPWRWPGCPTTASRTATSAKPAASRGWRGCSTSTRISTPCSSRPTRWRPGR